MLIDLHSDFIFKSLNFPNQEFQTNLQQLSNAKSILQVFAILFTSADKNHVLSTYNNSIAFFKNFLENNSQQIGLIHNYSDIEANIKSQKISAMLSLEDCQYIYIYKDYLDKIYQDGVRFAGLLWDHENSIGYSYKNNFGLKPEGIDLIKRLEAHKFIIDISHLSDKGVKDVFDNTKSALIASHSNTRTHTNHRRNLTDPQIKEIANRNGIIGINLFPKYIDIKEISEKSVSNLESIYTHINHLKNIGGEECIAIGADFDGMAEFTLKNLDYRNASQINNLANDLSKFFSDDFIEKILYKNALSFLKNNLM